MIILCASLIIVLPICLMLIFICDLLHEANRLSDRIASTLFLMEQKYDAETRRRK